MALADEADGLLVVGRQHEDAGHDLLALADVRHDGLTSSAESQLMMALSPSAAGEPQHAGPARHQDRGSRRRMPA
jgi:hypothetical protein